LGTINNYNLKLGWDGSLQGGTTYTWSITSSGKAIFNSMTVNSGSFNGYIYASGGTIGGCKISSGSISGTNWSLSNEGYAKFDGIQMGNAIFRPVEIRIPQSVNISDGAIGDPSYTNYSVNKGYTSSSVTLSVVDGQLMVNNVAASSVKVSTGISSQGTLNFAAKSRGSSYKVIGYTIKEEQGEK
jgi:hypothetical protein